MKSLTTLSKEVYDSMNQPHELAKIYIYCAASYAYYADQLKSIEIIKPEIWLKIKESGEEKDISDKKAEMLWMTREEGKKEIEYKYILKGLEKLMGAIKHSSFINNQEAKNQT